MNVLGINEGTGDPRFDSRSMVEDKAFLGDQMPYDPPLDKGGLHGVIIICAKGRRLIFAQL
jgi:hypothetical protein